MLTSRPRGGFLLTWQVVTALIGLGAFVLLLLPFFLWDTDNVEWSLPDASSEGAILLFLFLFLLIVPIALTFGGVLLSMRYPRAAVVPGLLLSGFVILMLQVVNPRGVEPAAWLGFGLPALIYGLLCVAVLIEQSRRSNALPPSPTSPSPTSAPRTLPPAEAAPRAAAGGVVFPSAPPYLDRSPNHDA